MLLGGLLAIGLSAYELGRRNPGWKRGSRRSVA
jgi:hypothetical protein